MRKVILGVFLGLLLAVLLAFAGLWGLVKTLGRQESGPAPHTLLVLDWNGALPGHQVHPADAGLDTPVTLSRVLEALREAAGREEIEGLLIRDNLELPREYLGELAGAVDAFRKAGKPVLAHLEMGLGQGYLTACLADTLALSPSASGGLLLPGPRVSRLYMAEALRKLGIQVNVLHQGEAKGYGEEYVLDAMSAPVRENLGRLVEDLLDEELGFIAGRRRLDAATLRRELARPEQLWLAPAQVRSLGLVDTLLSRADWEDALEARFPGHQTLRLSEWISSRTSLPGAGGETRDHIAVLWAEGEIVPGLVDGAQVRIQSSKMIEQIRDLRDDDAVKAVVLRVESPGGSALASEEIYQELVKLGKAKPLWVSAGPVAASGGYYLSVPAARLWASPFSVVGSIGVVALVPDLSGGAAKLGLRHQSISPLPGGKLGDLGAPVDPATLAALSARMGEIYGEFQSRVLAHRPLDAARLAPIAGGRVWAGRRAVQLGLVDRLGGLDLCLDSLQASLKMPGGPLPVAHYPIQESLISLLLNGHLKPRDLLPGAAERRLAATLGAPAWLGDVEQVPARLADPAWTLRMEDALQVR